MRGAVSEIWGRRPNIVPYEEKCQVYIIQNTARVGAVLVPRPRDDVSILPSEGENNKVMKEECDSMK